jgi:hypothetical protein
VDESGGLTLRQWLLRPLVVIVAWVYERFGFFPPVDDRHVVTEKES